MSDTKHGGTKHIWIDGPDGPKCNCPICGISKSEDYRRDDTCEKFILRQAERIAYERKVTDPDLPIFDVDVRLWERFLEEQDPRRDGIEFDDEEFMDQAAKAGYSFIARLRKSLGK